MNTRKGAMLVCDLVLVLLTVLLLRMRIRIRSRKHLPTKHEHGKTKTNWKKVSRESIQLCNSSGPETFNIIAVSGGADSMVLLNLISPLLGSDSVIAHFNHGGPGAADNESEQFVRSYCHQHSLPLEVGYGTYMHKNMECNARRQRYSFFRRVAEKYRQRGYTCFNIIVGHNQDDQIETILMNLMRGAKPEISSMARLTSYPVHNISIVRPLLDVPKDNIRTYARLHGINWIEDPGNNDIAFDRNYWRRQVIPLIKARYNIYRTINRAIVTPHHINVYGTVFDD